LTKTMKNQWHSVDMARYGASEQISTNLGVGGSNPSGRANKIKGLADFVSELGTLWALGWEWFEMVSSVRVVESGARAVE